MKRLLAIALIGFALCLAGPGFATDGDELTCDNRNRNEGWDCKRFLLLDSKAATGASSAKSIPKWSGTATPGMAYVWWVDQSDACTSFSVNVRQHRSASTANCEGTCDPVVITTFTEASTAAKMVSQPLYYAFDADVTAITACTISLFMDVFQKLN